MFHTLRSSRWLVGEQTRNAGCLYGGVGGEVWSICAWVLCLRGCESSAGAEIWWLFYERSHDHRLLLQARNRVRQILQRRCRPCGRRVGRSYVHIYQQTARSWCFENQNCWQVTFRHDFCPTQNCGLIGNREGITRSNVKLWLVGRQPSACSGVLQMMIRLTATA